MTTRSVAAQRGDIIIEMWLRLELEGVGFLKERKATGIKEDVYIKALYKWEGIHQVKDTEKMKGLVKAKLQRMERGWDTKELDKEIFALPSNYLNQATITEIADDLENETSIPDKGTIDFIRDISALNIIKRGESKKIIAKFKIAVQDYVNEVCAETRAEEAAKEDETTELKRKLARLERRSISRISRGLWDWISKHKLLTALGPLIGVLSFFGVKNCKDIYNLIIKSFEIIKSVISYIIG